MSISKKLRFEVFKRDNFKCQYCGNTPPDVILEVDHIEPKSKGGNDNINNLITSCFDCNRGKTNILLSNIPGTLKSNIEILKEKELQYKEYKREVEKIRKRKMKDCDKINNIYNFHFNEYVLSENFKRVTLLNFVEKLPIWELEDAMNLACLKINDSDESIKYFCGICWNKIRENG